MCVQYRLISKLIQFIVNKINLININNIIITENC